MLWVSVLMSVKNFYSEREGRYNPTMLNRIE
jgi:hypothetical protein